MKKLFKGLKHPIAIGLVVILGLAVLFIIAGMLAGKHEEQKRPPIVQAFEGGAEHIGRTEKPPQTPPPQPAGTMRYVEVSPIVVDAPENYQNEATSEYDLPAGTEIKVKLLNTLESSSSRQPVILLVTDDCFNSRGLLVVPAGTKAIGTLDTTPERDRVTAHETMNLIFADDSAMPIEAALLNASHNNAGTHYGATDGSVGLEGFQFSLREWLHVTRWVRVPAGKQGYLCLLKPIDRAKAERGGVGLASDVQEAQHDRERRTPGGAGNPLQALLSQPARAQRPAPLLKRIFQPSSVQETANQGE